MGSCYSGWVRVIARSTLNLFVQNRVEERLRGAVKGRLDAWYAEVSKAHWQNSADIKRHYATASIVSAERVVFNIRGNDYRLVVAIDYQHQIVLIVWIGTHKEYDKIEVGKVRYDKERYTDSSNPN
jgi:mRNA interferase HigB